MSLLTIGKTVWGLPTDKMKEMASSILKEHFPKIDNIQDTPNMRDETVQQMYNRVKKRWPHKIVGQLEKYIKTSLDSDAEVISINLSDWGWVYYVKNRDDEWDFIYDVKHYLCKQYVIEDFKNWVQLYGKEFVDILVKEADALIDEEYPYGEVEELTCDPYFTFKEKGGLVIAELGLGEIDE